MNVRPTPAQELPENQDPTVAYILDEQTGTRVPLPGGPLTVTRAVSDEVTPPRKKRGRPKRELGSLVEPAEVAAADQAAEDESDE